MGALLLTLGLVLLHGDLLPEPTFAPLLGLVAVGVLVAALLMVWLIVRSPGRRSQGRNGVRGIQLTGSEPLCEGASDPVTRICWVGLGQRDKLGLAFNEMVRNGELKAPVVIGRDHLDSGSVASPNRETEAMKDGSDAVSDWPLLNAMLNVAGGATWVSFHHGGGVGMGYSQHSGLVIVCDGTKEADERIARVLWNDPATGVMRHADAGYADAVVCAKEQGLKLPMV